MMISRVLLTTLAIVSIAQIAHGQMTVSFSGTGCVLLKHGNVIQGSVEPLGNKIVIHQGEGDRITLNSRDVEFIAANMQDLYRYRVERFGGRLESGEHFLLARWCLQYKMIDEAIVHWQALKPEYESSYAFRQLSASLKEALLQEDWAKQVQTRVAAKKTNGKIGNSAVQTASSNSKAASDAGSEVRTAEHSSSVNLSNDALVISQFRAGVQQVLINQCSQAGCHGAQANNPLRLTRIMQGNPRRSAELNITAVTPWINLQDPMKSPLLTKAITAHGSQKSPGISDGEMRLRLEEWLNLTARVARGEVIRPDSIKWQSNTGNAATTQANSQAILPWQARGAYLQSFPPGQEGATQLAGRPTGAEPPVVNVQTFNGPINDPSKIVLAQDVTPSELAALEAEITRAEAAPQNGDAKTAVPPANDPFDPSTFNQVNQPKRP